MHRVDSSIYAFPCGCLFLCGHCPFLSDSVIGQREAVGNREEERGGFGWRDFLSYIFDVACSECQPMVER